MPGKPARVGKAGQVIFGLGLDLAVRKGLFQHGLLVVRDGVLEEEQLGQEGQLSQWRYVADPVERQVQSFQFRQPCKRRYVADLVVEEEQPGQVGQLSERGEVADLVVAEKQPVQVDRVLEARKIANFLFLPHEHPERSQVLAGYCAFGFPQLPSDDRLEIEILELDDGDVGRFVLGHRGMFVGFHACHHETVSTSVKG